MKTKKWYYKDINIVRLTACISIFLYHLGLLKGGYLAVCTFFVLTGFLSCISAFKEEKFSIINYYKNRLLKVYIPLIIVVFLTVFTVSLFSDIIWLNLKPETTSVILGYNNFWQISANLDYFARHISSPFMHFWYIGILLQFELIFPFIYIVLRKMGDKIHKLVPISILSALSIGSFFFFLSSLSKNNITFTYYHTFTRFFSIFFGLSLGFIHHYYEPRFLFKNKYLSKFCFLAYLLLCIMLFIFIDYNSKFFALSMLLTSLFTCRLIDYSTILNAEELSLFDVAIKKMASISYEIYLFQYPVIFIIRTFSLNRPLEIIIIISLTIILSLVIHYIIYHKTNNIFLNIIKYFVFLIVSLLVLYGIYLYYRTPDYTNEMEALKNELTENAKLVNQKKDEYQEYIKEEQEKWNSVLENFENEENSLKEYVQNLPVIGIGDSVMLGAVSSLSKTFPKGYFDAKVSRTAWTAASIIKDLQNKNLFGEPIIINLGTNGDCSKACKQEIIEICGNKDIFWLTATNNKDVHVNEKLIELEKNYSNVHIIDWDTISKNHNEYFIADGIHLTNKGKEVFTHTIYEAIYKVYYERYQEKKNTLIENHEKELKKKISFYGNDLLLNAYSLLLSNFKDARFTIKKAFNYDLLKEELIKDITNKDINYKVVIALDNTAKLNSDNYEDLLNLLKNNEVYLLTTEELSLSITPKNAHIINFNAKLINHPEYIMPDKIHLTQEGNKALNCLLLEVLNNPK